MVKYTSDMFKVKGLKENKIKKQARIQQINIKHRNINQVIILRSDKVAFKKKCIGGSSRW